MQLLCGKQSEPITSAFSDGLEKHEPMNEAIPLPLGDAADQYMITVKSHAPLQCTPGRCGLRCELTSRGFDNN